MKKNRNKYLLSVFVGLLLILLNTNPLYSQDLNHPDNLHSAIVKINWRYLNLTVIDDQSIYDGSINTFLNEKGTKYLDSISYEALEGLTFRKVFPSLKTTDTVSISRLGKKIWIPTFWSVFAVDVDPSINVYDFCRSMERLSPFIFYAHPNYKGKLQSDPDDPEFVNQHSFKSTLYPFADIDLDSAWNIETGKPFIKVGVYDSGIDTSHPDLKILGGKGSYISGTLQNEWGYDVSNHGTKVAGIIGARRNNSTGVAGIAGGDGSDTTGVSIIDFLVLPPQSVNVEMVCSGIVDGARSVGSYYDWTGIPTLGDPLPQHLKFSQGFGIHLANHSYRFEVLQFKTEDPPFENDTDLGGKFDNCLLCIEAYLFSLENNVTHVVARGNAVASDSLGPNSLWPQSYPDHMVTSVGGTAYDGNWWSPLNSSSTDNGWAMIGQNIDLAAPGSDSIITTTWSLHPLLSGDLYGKFNGTSASAPHVTGALALLLSYYNKPCYSNYNLANEDLEYLLQISAVDINAPGYDEHSGHGRLSVDNLFDSLNRPFYQIVHPEDNPIDYMIYPPDTVVIVGKQFQSYGPYSSEDLTDPQIFPNVLYNVQRFKIEATYSFSSYVAGADVELLGAWPRINTSTFSEYMEDDTYVGNPPSGSYFKQMKLQKSVDLIGYDQNSIVMSGYLYRFYEDYYTGAPTNAWYPTDTSNFRFDYSVYLRDTVNGLFFDFPCDTIFPLYDYTAGMTKELISDFSIYPNPFQERFTIQCNSQPISDIYVYDITGRIVFSRLNLGSPRCEIELSGIADGIYLVEIVASDNSRLTKKIIKR